MNTLELTGSTTKERTTEIMAILERNDPHYNHYVDQYFQMFHLVRDPES